MKILTDNEIEDLFDSQLNKECTAIMFGESQQNYKYEDYNFAGKIENAFKLIKHVESKGFCCALKTPINPKSYLCTYKVYQCVFVEHDKRKEDRLFDNWSTGSTIEIAICRSFLKWHRNHENGNLTNRKYYED